MSRLHTVMHFIAKHILHISHGDHVNFSSWSYRIVVSQSNRNCDIGFIKREDCGAVERKQLANKR